MTPRQEHEFRAFALDYPREAAFLLMTPKRTQFIRGVMQFVCTKGYLTYKQLDCIRNDMARKGDW